MRAQEIEERAQEIRKKTGNLHSKTEAKYDNAQRNQEKSKSLETDKPTEPKITITHKAGETEVGAEITGGVLTKPSSGPVKPNVRPLTSAGKTDRREPRLSVPDAPSEPDVKPTADPEPADRDTRSPESPSIPSEGSTRTQTPYAQQRELPGPSENGRNPAGQTPGPMAQELPTGYQLYQTVAIPVTAANKQSETRPDEGGPGEQQTILQSLDVVWRRKRVVVTCVVVFVGLVWIALSQVAPRYTAEALVLIKPSDDKVVDIESVVSGLTNDPTEILNQVQVLRSRRLAERAIDETNLAQLPEFNPSLKTQQTATSTWAQLVSQTTNLFDGLTGKTNGAATVNGPTAVNRAVAIDVDQLRTKVVNSFHKALRVAPVGESSVISIKFTSVDPNLAALVTNKIADLYILDQLEAKYEATQLATEWLQGRIAELQETVQASEAAVENYRSESGLLRGNSNTTLLTDQITQISSQRAFARADLADLESKLAIAEKLASEDDLKTLADVMNSPVIQQQKQEEARVLRRRAELAGEVGPRHPLLVSLNAELEDIGDQLAREVRSVLSRIRNDVQVARTRLDTLSRALKDLEGQAEEANESEIQLRALEREADANRALFETFLSRFKETEEQEELSRPDSRVISYAAIPQAPSFPKKGIVILAAVIISGLFGVFVCFMLELAQSRLQSLDQIETLGLQPLALIPIVGGSRKKKKPQDYILHNPGSAYAESLRALHTSILVSDVENRTRCVLITSTVPGEGKTTLAISLARLLTGMGSKVLLIDCDMRRPSIHRAMGVNNDFGLIDHMVGSMSRSAITRKDPKSGIAFVTPGRLTRNAVDLLRSQQMRNLVHSFQRDYDLVILDSAPLLPVSDARILAGLADATIFAVKWRSTRRRHINHAVRLLKDARAKILGAVLTQVDVRKHSRERYSDSGYYTKKYNAYYTD